MGQQQRVALGRSWRDHIRHQQPEQFITLTNAWPFSDRIAEEGLRFFVKALVRSMPRRVQPHFAGVIAAERTIKNVKFEGTLHFHFVVWGLRDHMPDASEWLQQAVVRTSERLVTETGLRMCQARHSDVQPIEADDEELVSAYETKDLYRRERPAGAQILLVQGSEVIGTLLTKGDSHET